MLVGVDTGPAWGWLEVVLMTGPVAAEDGVVMVIGVVDCMPATVVGACCSAWLDGIAGVWGDLVGSRLRRPVLPLMTYLPGLLSLFRAWSILGSRCVS